MVNAAMKLLGVAALAAAWALASCPAAAAESPAGRTVIAAKVAVGPEAFESASPVRSREPRVTAMVFDRSRLCDDYETPWIEYRVSEHLRITRPYDGSSFPANMAAPLFRWEDETSDLWMVSLKAPGWREPLRVVTGRKEWRPDEDVWDAAKKDSAGGEVELEVRGRAVRDGGPSGEVYADGVRFRFSTFEADPVVVYREVTPLFHGLKTPDIKYLDIAGHEPRMFLPGAGEYCTNCHSFPVRPDVPRDRLNVSIAVRRNVGMRQYRILGLYNLANRWGKTLNTDSYFMAWNPSGKSVAVTAGASVAVRPLITLETQQFYVKVADIRIVDAETLESFPLPGASTSELMETLPTWSPDGRTIVFARAPELGAEFEERQFDLYAVDYNDGRGGEPRPVRGASQNGRSNYAPRFSPDGRWLVFNEAAYSSLVAPTSDLWIVSTAEDAPLPRELECNVPEAGDSHHSWSSNSKWLLFASKRDDGVFARLYLTEIDESGHASPPVELPFGEDPMICYNVPEFLRYRYDIDALDILRKTGSLKGVIE